MLRSYHTVRIFRIPSRYRMCSTTLIYPDQVFSKAVPSPKPWPTQNPSSLSRILTSTSLREWKEAEGTDKRISHILTRLQNTLRYVHKRKITWPTAECNSSNLEPDEYLAKLLRPIANIFNELCSPDLLKAPLMYEPLVFGESIYGATFTAEEFQNSKLTNHGHIITPPIVLCLPGGLFDSQGKVSSHVEYALCKALEYNPLTPSIIVSNFTDIVIFSLAGKGPEDKRPVFEIVSTTEPSRALRIISTACLYWELNRKEKGYIKKPDVHFEIDRSMVLPAGPPQNPNQPLLPDEQIFATHHRHSDFDFETLIRDRASALQFFRWHRRVRQTNSKVVAHPGDTLTALTNEVGQELPENGPIYPYDPSELPEDTLKHLELIQRQSPLETAGIADLLKQSKSFTLKIQDVLAAGTERGIATVYRCQITSIDNDIVSSPSVCLKLFDDRFQLLNIPNEEDEYYENDDFIPRWFDAVVIAEDCAINEAYAYEKLLPVQGTLIPWFYGTHQFTLPDGTVLYGLLMEYIDGCALDSNAAQGLSSNRQINMIQSCRHAIRILDVADVCQRDWHSGQILIYTNPTTKIDHVVLIDFASTTQTWNPDAHNYIDNYKHVFMLLRRNKAVFDTELIWQYFDEPDDWDPIRFYTPRRPEDEEWVCITARDMFPCISHC